MIEKQITGLINFDDSESLKFEKMSSVDISDVLKIQEEQSISKVIEEKSGNKDEIERNGFLVHLLSEDELSEILNIPEGIETIVCKEGGEIVGYSIGYNLELWKKLNPDWESSVRFLEGFDKAELSSKSVYLRHINTSPRAKAGTGKKISMQFIEQSKSRGFLSVFGEILKEPYANKASMAVHKRMGFAEIGEIREKDSGQGELIWALMQKKLEL